MFRWIKSLYDAPTNTTNTYFWTVQKITMRFALLNYFCMKIRINLYTIYSSHRLCASPILEIIWNIFQCPYVPFLCEKFWIFSPRTSIRLRAALAMFFLKLPHQTFVSLRNYCVYRLWIPHVWRRLDSGGYRRHERNEEPEFLNIDKNSVNGLSYSVIATQASHG